MSVDSWDYLSCQCKTYDRGPYMGYYPISDYTAIVIITPNGSKQVKKRCNKCLRKTGAIRKSEWAAVITGTEITEVSERSHKYENCSVRGCTDAGMEYHHFAPVNTFGFTEAERWPVLPLCKSHHRQWHNTMNGYHTNNVSIDRTETA